MAKSTPVPNVVKGTSPSKNIQRGADTAWNEQKGYKDAQCHGRNKDPISVGENLGWGQGRKSSGMTETPGVLTGFPIAGSSSFPVWRQTEKLCG